MEAKLKTNIFYSKPLTSSLIQTALANTYKSLSFQTLHYDLFTAKDFKVLMKKIFSFFKIQTEIWKEALLLITKQFHEFMFMKKSGTYMPMITFTMSALICSSKQLMKELFAYIISCFQTHTIHSFDSICLTGLWLITNDLIIRPQGIISFCLFKVRDQVLDRSSLILFLHIWAHETT